MSAALQVLVSVVGVAVMLTLLVVVHEGGHALAARLCGARVTEFFVGLPLGPSVSWQSRRTGVRYGATLALLGGYTRVAGMSGEADPLAPLVLAVANARGRLTAREAARAAGMDEERALLVLEQLGDWGSLVPVRDGGALAGRDDPPEAYETPRRDTRGLTVLDRAHDFSLPGGSSQGEPYFPPESADAFFEAERARTYQGLGLARRLCVLVAGVACNIALAFVVIVAYCCLHGLPAATATVASVEAGSAAQAAGIEDGDTVVAVGGAPVDGYEGLSSVLEAQRGSGEAFAVELARGGRQVVVEAGPLASGEPLGVACAVADTPVPLGTACAIGASTCASVARAAASLLVPSQAAEVIEGSAGVVGVAAMTGSAASQGPWSLALLAGLISLSLGWMNLLPVPPLDGGKAVLELVGALMGRPVPQRVQIGLSMAGMALFALLFVYLVAQDVARLVGA